jgi:hypothetical protein
MSDGVDQPQERVEQHRFWLHHAVLPAIVFAGVLTIVIGLQDPGRQPRVASSSANPAT